MSYVLGSSERNMFVSLKTLCIHEVMEINLRIKYDLTLHGTCQSLLQIIATTNNKLQLL